MDDDGTTFGGYLDSEELEMLRTAITNEAFDLRDRLGLSGDSAAILATRMMRAVEKAPYPEPRRQQ